MARRKTPRLPGENGALVLYDSGMDTTQPPRSHEPNGRTVLHPGWRLRAAQGAWLLLFLLPTALFAAGLGPFFRSQQAVSTPYALYVVALDGLFMGSFALTALLIFWRRADDWFALFVSVGLIMTGTRFSNSIAYLGELGPGWGTAVNFVNFVGALSALIFFYHFPDGRLTPRRLRPLLGVWFLWVCAWQWLPPAVNPTVLQPLPARLFDLALLSTGVYAQLYRYRRVAGPLQKQQTKWVVYGAIVGVSGYYGYRLLVFFFPILQENLAYRLATLPIFFAFLLLIPFSIGISILRFRLWDIDPLIYRTLVYGALTGVLAIIYFVSVVVLQRLFRILSGQESDLALVASTLLIAALFQPLRRRVQRRIDRLFYREKINVRQALTGFSQEIRTIIELPELLDVLTRRVMELLHVRRAAVFLRERGGRLELAEQRDGAHAEWRPALTVALDELPLDRVLSRPQDDEFILLAPLIAPSADAAPHGQSGQPYLVGVLALGPRLAGRPYTADDQSLLMILGDQAGTAIYVAQLAAEKQRVDQELALAWRIQQSFLPPALPEIPGWELTAVLRPARETCGDFYDVMALPDGRFGLLIADVADKGMAAALYMALSRTLLRTYAAQYPNRPDLALRAANERILLDTHSDQFVTVFYAILDPRRGRLAYANAGHNPPYLLGADGRLQKLGRTGIPLGVFPEMGWETAVVQAAPGDLLLLYTDGVTEAHNRRLEAFGERRLLAVLEGRRGAPAVAIQTAVLEAIADFTGAAPQFDDVTLLVLRRVE
jgi:serine phosphatase RsbU (regulator of sigma subunit)